MIAILLFSVDCKCQDRQGLEGRKISLLNVYSFDAVGSEVDKEGTNDPNWRHMATARLLMLDYFTSDKEVEKFDHVSREATKQSLSRRMSGQDFRNLCGLQIGSVQKIEIQGRVLKVVYIIGRKNKTLMVIKAPKEHLFNATSSPDDAKKQVTRALNLLVDSLGAFSARGDIGSPK